MSELTITPLDRKAALAVARWRYPPPYDLYEVDGDAAVFASLIGRGDSGYYQLRDREGRLVAFCCFGEEAQVPGGDYSAPALDVGLGVRPDLTGRGQGRRFLDAILAFGVARFEPPALRLTVASFNARAIRLYAGAGFGETQRFTSAYARREFLVMARELSRTDR